MPTYIVTINYKLEAGTREHRVVADTPMEAVLMAGAFAGKESEGNCDSFELVCVDEIQEHWKRVWTR